MTPIKAKILIIDDETDFTMMLSKRIKLAGYDVVCYPQGDSAVTTTINSQPDLVLLDINLPGLSGLEVFERLQEVKKEFRNAPIIFLSAVHAKENYCLNSLKAAGFLKKPCSSMVILKTIEKALAAA